MQLTPMPASAEAVSFVLAGGSALQNAPISQPNPVFLVENVMVEI